MHPAHRLAELAKHAAKKALIERGVLCVVVDEIEELTATEVFEDEHVVGGCGERSDVGHDRAMGYVLCFTTEIKRLEFGKGEEEGRQEA